jgi:CheY-like chemotaxis protein
MFMRPDERRGEFIISVRDDGEGIVPENLPHIFELYYTSRTDGSGIGLALSKQLVEQMGGVISVASAQGEGAEFTVTLPVSVAVIPEDGGVNGGGPTHCGEEEIPRAGLGTGSSRPAIGTEDKPTILVVEDNRDMAKYIATVLGGRYTVLNAANGVEGLSLAEQYVPDLVITDVMMPEKDGYSLTADLRASVATSHIPVVMLTARATLEDKLEGLGVGADAYLPKPFDERELLATITQLLDSRASCARHTRTRWLAVVKPCPTTTTSCS